MRAHRWAFIATVLLACGDTGHDAPEDAGSDADSSCSLTCLESTWWLASSSTCQVLCTGNPSLDECTQSDCESLEARRYAGGTREVLAPVLHSASTRSFYVFAAATSGTYSVEPACQLRQGSDAPRTFTCTTTMLTLPTSGFAAADGAQSGALDAALQAGAEGRHTY